VVNKEIVRKRLNKLDEYLDILNQIKQYSFEAFIANPEHYGSAERFLHLAIEAVNDIGNHIVADDALGTVNWYSDIPVILEENEVITIELKDLWIRMIGFRNTLVHEYIEIDRQIVYDVLQNSTRDFDRFRRVFARYL
jgi:uncharacterized protein YutE (UPF0331/DUF86 family)